MNAEQYAEDSYKEEQAKLRREILEREKKRESDLRKEIHEMKIQNSTRNVHRYMTERTYFDEYQKKRNRKEMQN